MQYINPTEADLKYWLDLEARIRNNLVDLAQPPYEFVVEPDFEDDDPLGPRCMTRPGVAEGLVTARNNLPKGYNFKVVDAWRSPTRQGKLFADYRETIIDSHPEYSEADIQHALQQFCPPPPDIMFDMGTHRHAGSLDLTVVDAAGEELNMGATMGDVSTPEAEAKCSLFYFHRLPSPTPEDLEVIRFRDILIQAMEKAFFVPLVVEWWHWNYTEDLYYHFQKTAS